LVSLLCFVIIFPFNSFSGSSEKTDQITLTYKLDHFYGLNIKSGFDIVLHQFEADPGQLKLSGTENQLKNVKFEVIDGVLNLSSGIKTENSQPIKVYVTFTDLQLIKTQGIVNITTQENMCLKKINLDLSEETYLTLFVSSLDFMCDASGKGTVNISGDITNFRLSCSSETVIDCNVLTHNLYTYLQDETQVNVKGKADFFQVKVINESFLNAYDLKTSDCVVTVGDYGDACLSVSKTLEITGTKDGSVSYNGAPVITNRYVSESVFVRSNKSKKSKELTTYKK